MYIMPNFIKQIIYTLNSAGHEAYLVGGAVRDIILDISPDDYDIATSADPEAVIGLFENTAKTGLKHGTVTVILNNNTIEVTTFRNDGEYSDHRKPDKVKFVKDIRGDLARRDFTINAMAYSEKSGIIDIFGGRDDLKNGIIRTVGKPETRFSEDALRILRAFRFSARYGFKIEDNTLSAVESTAQLLQLISRERIFVELSKILLTSHPSRLAPLIKCGGFEFLGLARESDISLLDATEKDLNVRFYALCLLCKTDSCELCRAIRGDNRLLKYCKNLDMLFSERMPVTRSGIKKMLNKTDENSTHGYLKLETLIFSKPDSSGILNDIIIKREPYRISDLTVSGDDLINIGYKGNTIGKLLHYLLMKVMEDPLNNRPEILISLAKKYNV